MKEVPLTQGKVALVDDEDYEKVNQFKWRAQHQRTGRWYAVRSVCFEGKWSARAMHRLIMGLEHDDPLAVDHRDRVNTLDNRKSNLRIATRNQNNRNIGIPKHNTSGYKGVCWRERHRKWDAQIRVNRKTLWLGYFPTRELAAVAYDTAAIELHGEFAVTNAALGLLKKPVQSTQSIAAIAA